MAVALGLSPFEVERVAAEAPEVLDAMRVAVADRWTTDTELLAGIYEQQHATNRLLAQLGGAKPDELPDPVRVPRPHQHQHTPTRKTASGRELAAWVARRRRGGTT